MASAAGSGRYLTADQIVEICHRYGKTPTAVTYQPGFLDRVYVLGVGAQPVNPMYCLSMPSAFELLYILRDLNPVMWRADPSPMSMGSPFYYSEKVPWAYSEKVPWAVFNNGAQRNLGTLAYYWVGNNGDPGGNTAEKNARTDIAFG